MAIDPNNFLHSLATFMAAAVSPALELANTPRALWRNLAVEGPGQTTDPYSVLRCYGGPATGHNPLERFSVQCMTWGMSADATVARAFALRATLLAPDGLPLRMKLIAAVKTDGTADTPGSYRLVRLDVAGAPGLIGIDDQKRHQAPFNFDVAAVQV
jgi:hypothetical protein